jgi:hypothetical protein
MAASRPEASTTHKSAAEAQRHLVLLKRPFEEASAGDALALSIFRAAVGTGAGSTAAASVWAND